MTAPNLAPALGGRPVMACIPYFRCKRYIRRAVESLLSQTHRNLTVIVMNDGDSNPPWDELSSIRDPRLIRFHLPKNRGPYFATSVALHATTAPYLLIQDADDWSAPERISVLLDRLERDHSDFVVSAQPVLAPGGNGRYRIIEMRWTAMARNGVRQRFTVTPFLTGEYLYRAPHHGLFRTSSLKTVGAYYAGLRYSYDTLLTNLLLMTGKVSHVPEPLYFRFVRSESITHSALTGVGSNGGRAELEIGRRLYRKCFEVYSAFLAGRLPASAFASSIRRISSERVSDGDRASLALEIGRLKRTLRMAARE